MGPVELRTRGDGGGLRDLDRRASSCRKGIGENNGVDGVDDEMGGMRILCRPSGPVSVSEVTEGGKLSFDDVTSNDFSTARKYLPTEL